MSNFKQISYGASGEEVKTLQTLLAERGYTQVGAADGIFGAKTQAALRAYQADNALAVDGIAGPQTWASLTATADEPQTSAPSSSVYDPAANTAYNQALADRDALLATPPKEENPWRDQAESLYSQLESRPDFTWDPAADTLYQTYRRQLLHDGRLAMEDTLGRTTALTGGYANTYAQVAGQQTYGEYLRRLSQAMPEYYDQARQSYDAQTDALAQRYEAALALSDRSYDAYRDQVKDYENRLKALEEQAETAWNQGYDAWQTEQKTRKEAYDRLEDLLKAGYTPTQAELDAAGMTAAQAAALGATAKKSGSSGGSSSSTSSSSGVSKDRIRQIQKRLGLEETGVWDGETARLAANKWNATTAAEAWEALNTPAKNTGYGNYEAVTDRLVQMVQSGATEASLKAYLDTCLQDKTLALGAYYALLARFNLS